METALTEARIRQARAAGFWRDESVEIYLDRWARERPDRTAIVDGAGRLSYAALARRVERVAHGLRGHGVEQGSVVSCQQGHHHPRGREHPRGGGREPPLHASQDRGRGHADPRLGERACAVVIPREGQCLTLPEVIAFLERHQLAR
jgi:non-ribosomal peptide synthetase component E (peptide arylation enzyme)